LLPKSSPNFKCPKRDSKVFPQKQSKTLVIIQVSVTRADVLANEGSISGTQDQAGLTTVKDKTADRMAEKME
jgi:hypothetical protein